MHMSLNFETAINTLLKVHVCLVRGMWLCILPHTRCVVPASQLEQVLVFRTGFGCGLCLCVGRVPLAAFSNPPFSTFTWCQGHMHAGDAYEAI